MEQALQGLFAESDVAFGFDHAFVCEIDKHKRAWLADVANSFVARGAPCIFDDVTTLHTGLSRCSQHNDFCRVPHPHIFTCGFSCKFVSHCNTGASSSEKRECLSDPSGQNSTTRTPGRCVHLAAMPFGAVSA